MLDEQCQLIIKEGHRRFVETKDMKHIDDAVNLVKTIRPERFFQGAKDPALQKRVFFHEPYGANWSGTYILPYGAK